MSTSPRYAEADLSATVARQSGLAEGIIHRTSMLIEVADCASLIGPTRWFVHHPAESKTYERK